MNIIPYARYYKIPYLCLILSLDILPLGFFFFLFLCTDKISEIQKNLLLFLSLFLLFLCFESLRKHEGQGF